MCVCLIYECDFPFLNGNIVFTAATIVTKLDSSSIEEQQKHQGDQSLNVPMNGVANSSNSPIGSFCSFVWESFSGRGGKRRRRRPPRKLDVSNTCNQYSFIRFFASLSLSLSLSHTYKNFRIPYFLVVGGVECVYKQPKNYLQSVQLR